MEVKQKNLFDTFEMIELMCIRIQIVGYGLYLVE